jgi:hypothetical protein
MTLRRDVSSIVNALKADKRVERLRNNFDTKAIFNLDTAKLYDEILSYHMIRGIRRLNPQEPKFLEQLLKANTDDQTYRSRMTEIMVECGRANAILEKSVDYLTQYFITAYSPELKSYRTAAERAYVIRAALKPFHDYITEVVSVKEAAALVVKDIDNGAWSLRMSVDVMKIHSTREHVM